MSRKDEHRHRIYIEGDRGESLVLTFPAPRDQAQAFVDLIKRKSSGYATILESKS